MTGERYVNPVPQYLDDNGAPLPGAKIYFFENGTTTPKETYADVDLTIPNPHPVECDGAGRLTPNVFLQNSSYRVELRDQDDVLIWQKDDVNNIVQNTTTGVLPFPGMVIGFYGTQDQLDVWLSNQWFVMDGNNGTQNTDESYFRGTTNVAGIGLTGGQNLITPTGVVEDHVLTLDEIPPHSHGLDTRDDVDTGGPAATCVTNGGNDRNTALSGGGQAHAHGLTMDQNTNEPKHIQLIWLIFQGT